MGMSFKCDKCGGINRHKKECSAYSPPGSACSGAMTVEEAKKKRCCRICGGPDSPNEHGSFMLNYGEEYAHEGCLEGLSPIPNKYSRTIQSSITPNTGITVDVYCVLRAFKVDCPAIQHAVKKLLLAGNRGHKSIETDLKEALNSVSRAIELRSGP